MDFMNEALIEAKKAFELNEVPIGAVIVCNNKIIARSHNMCEKDKNSTKHAEIIAIDHACRSLDSKNLENCEMYVTVEPCPMCACAIGLSRIKRVYVGCEEPKTGALGSAVHLSKYMPWNFEVYFGFHEEECKKLIKNFFENKR